jgi:hypothetical protein
MTPVGIGIGQHVGAGASQFSLDAFHIAGSSRSSNAGIKALKEVLLNRTRKNKFMVINFKDKNLSHAELLEYQKLYQEVKFWDLVHNEQLIQVKKDDNVSCDAGGTCSSFLERDKVRMWWHVVYANLTRRAVPENYNYIYRLYLRTDVMYEHGITMEMLVEQLEDVNIKTQKFAHVVPSPFSDGIIDLFIYDDQVRKTYPDIASLGGDIAVSAAVNLGIKPELKNIRVKGIPGISAVYAMKEFKNPVISIIYSQDKLPYAEVKEEFGHVFNVDALGLTGENAKSFWVIQIDETMGLDRGITTENIVRLFRLIKGINIVAWNNLYIHATTDGASSPMEMASKAAAASKETHNKALEKLQIGKYVGEFPEYDDIMRHYDIGYVETNGINMEDILIRDEVDPVRTYCNDPNDIQKIFGVRATKSLFVRELKEVLMNSGQNLDDSLLLLAGDTLVNHGFLQGVTYASLNKGVAGFLDKAGMERPLSTFMNASWGEVDTLNSATSNIVLGKRVKAGTSGFDVMVNDAGSSIKFEDWKAKVDGGLTIASPAAMSAGIKSKSGMILPETYERNGEGKVIITSPDERLESQKDYAAKGVFTNVIAVDDNPSIPDTPARSGLDIPSNASINGDVSSLSSLRSIRQKLTIGLGAKKAEEASSSSSSSSAAKEKTKKKVEAAAGQEIDFDDLASMLENMDYSDEKLASTEPSGPTSNLNIASLESMPSW